ncbi:MAG: hypothetical protein QM778_13185 [Myxococcales bacterium]
MSRRRSSSLARPSAPLGPWILGSLLVAACSGTASAPAATPRYPELPKPAAAETSPRFLPEAALQAVQLPCGASELPDNGLDDDCDGVVDSPKSAASKLTISLAYRAETPGEVRLHVTSESASPVPNLGRNPDASRGPAVAVSRLDLSALPGGRYRLSASRPGGEAEPAELSLAVSSATLRSVQTYLVRLGAGETRTLGLIEVP